LKPARQRIFDFGQNSAHPEEQTVNHVVLHCPIHRPPHGLHGLTVLDDETIEWLLNTCPRFSVAKQWLEELAQKKCSPDWRVSLVQGLATF